MTDNQTALDIPVAEISAATISDTRPCPFQWNWPGIRLGWPKDWPHPWYSGPQNATLILGPPRSGKTTGLIAPP